AIVGGSSAADQPGHRSALDAPRFGEKTFARSDHHDAFGDGGNRRWHVGRHRHRPMPSSVAHRPARAATARKIRWIKGCEEARPHSPIEYRITYCRGANGDLRGIPAPNRNW